jgi:hypothetical protein
VRRAAIALVAATAALAGCGGSEPAPHVESPASRLIRDWLMALEHGDYGQAARFFAPGAVVDEGRSFRLDKPGERRFFNATLPCRADLVGVRPQGGGRVIATFTLRRGPGGECRGLSRVQYRIERGKFTEYRLLGPPKGSAA